MNRLYCSVPDPAVPEKSSIALTLAVPLFCLGFGVYYLLQGEFLAALFIQISGGFLSLMFFAVKEPYLKRINEAWSEFKRAKAD